MTAAILGALLAAAHTGASPTDAGTGMPLDRVAAVVDDSPILRSEVVERAEPELRRLEAEGIDPEEEARRRLDLLRASLQVMIDERLLDEQLKSANVSVTNEELDASIADVKRNNHLQDDQAFEAALAHEGLTLDTYRTNLKRQLEKLKLINIRVHPQVKVTETELQDEYQKSFGREAGEEEIRARHILLALKKDSSPEERTRAQARAMELAQRARAGEDFAKLAHQYSDGPSAAQGGELGYFKHGVMVPEFEASAFSLRKGEISDPVLTHFGYHVIQLEDRRRTPQPAYAQVKEQLRQRLTQHEMERLTTEYLKGLRKDASIQIRIDELKPRAELKPL